MVASSLVPGTYRVVVYAHSTVTGTFNNERQVDVTVALGPDTFSTLTRRRAPRGD